MKISLLLKIGCCMGLTSAASLNTQAQSPAPAQKESRVTAHATGPFEVKTTPQDDKSGATTLGRLLLDKQYHGDLDGTGKGQMLTAGLLAKGSAGYVAMEHVNGTLKGQAGSFTLQHSGTISNGVQQLLIIVVPGSGTGQLEGISGKMTINIAGGMHSYDLEYALPKTD
jgi:hypothetical protein